MKRFLLDTNVIMDMVFSRKPHAEASTAVCRAIERGAGEGILSAQGITTIGYFIRKDGGNVRTKAGVADLLRMFEIAAVNRTVLEDALTYSCPDFEDAVTAAAAYAAGCDFIVTRDPKGFRGSRLRCLTPEAALPLLRIE
jgi:predicted nucleic acid-binding protein